MMTRSSAYSRFHGGSHLASFDTVSTNSINKNGLRTEPWCNPIFMLKGFLIPCFDFIRIVVPAYFPDPAWDVVSWAFYKSPKVVYSGLLPSRYFSMKVLSVKIASGLPTPFLGQPVLLCYLLMLWASVPQFAPRASIVWCNSCMPLGTACDRLSPSRLVWTHSASTHRASLSHLYRIVYLIVECWCGHSVGPTTLIALSIFLICFATSLSVTRAIGPSIDATSKNL